MNIKLTPEERDFIAGREAEIAVFVKALDAIRQFKLGDYLIGFHPNHYGARRQITNSYGVPKKFQVVVVDGFGVPYMKELNKNGKPHGTLICPIKTSLGNKYQEHVHDIEFELDPDYADALILDEPDFNASLNHQVKANLFKEITTYNKENKINTRDLKKLVEFIGSLSGGDVVWRSSTTSWLILSTKPIPRDAANRIKQDEVFIQIQTSKGEIKDLAFWDLKGKALYKNRPRSYKELRDLI